MRERLRLQVELNSSVCRKCAEASKREMRRSAKGLLNSKKELRAKSPANPQRKRLLLKLQKYSDGPKTV